MKTTILFLFFLIPLYRGAIAQYDDLVAQKNINTLLNNFSKNFLIGKLYSEDTTFTQPQDTVWSILKAKEEIGEYPCTFYGMGFEPFNYAFEYKKFTDGSVNLKIHFKNRLAFEKIECEISSKDGCIKDASFLCIPDSELSYYSYYACKRDFSEKLMVSTETLKEFEEKLKMILPYL